MASTYLKDLRKRTLKKGREGLIENLITRKFSFWLTAILIKTPITANQVTGISLIIALIGSVFFSFGDFKNQVIGAILLFLSHIFDFSDGEIARLKGTSSMFGFWWDECADRIREYAYILGLTIGLFRTTQNTFIIFMGMLAGMNILMLHFVRQLTLSKLTGNKRTSEFKIGKKYYFGFSGTTIYLVIIAVLFKLVYWFLLVYATLGALGWLRKIYSSFKLRKTITARRTHIWK